MLLAEPYYLFIFNLSIGVILGSLFYRGDYCMAGMFRDVFLLKDYTLLRSLHLLIVVAMVLFYAARISGLILLYPPPPYSYASVTTFVGGLIFGVGMVMAGGCVVGTLYKMAAGNLTNLIAFGGIIAGSMVYAEFHPLFVKFRKNTVLLKDTLLSDIAPKGEMIAGLLIIMISLLIFIKWKKENKWAVNAYANGYLQPWKTAIYIAILNVLIYIFSGWPMGVTTAYAKIGAYIEGFFAPSHVTGVLYFNQPSVTAEIPGAIIQGGAGPNVDIITFTELALITGIILGAFLTAVYLREFKVYGFPPAGQAISAFAGGTFLAVGARVAGGCNVKFVLGAVPLLSFQGIVFLAGLVVGAYVGSLIIKRIVLGA